MKCRRRAQKDVPDNTYMLGWQKWEKERNIVNKKLKKKKNGKFPGTGSPS